MWIFWVVTLALEMEAVCSYETLVSTQKSRRRYNPKDQRDIFTAVRTSNLNQKSRFLNPSR
jgi:hypothetical protein